MTEPTDLAGQTWLITGATGGVGLETARAAAGRGARVILGVRNTSRGAQVAAELPDAEVLELDLSSLDSVRAAAAKVPDIDVLVNNAGVSADKRTETADGFELDLATNVIGPFLFTNLVLDRVRDRVVIVSSATMVFGKTVLDLDDPNFRTRAWKKSDAYAHSKLMVMLWGSELARRTPDRKVVLTYPGWAATGISNPTPWKILDRPMQALTRRMGQDAAAGAQCSVYAATADVPTGSYIGPDGDRNLKGAPTSLEIPANAADPAAASRVWDYLVEAAR
jgi:NAD(P)-dependent dehydrogenase (short-subunit alcohol dehydrogenase family)